MKVIVLGAGGVGGYLGALLARSGHRVLFIDPWREHVEAIMRHGLRVSGQESFTIQVEASADLDLGKWQNADLLILATKNIDNSGTLRIVDHLQVEAATSVQNGLNASDELANRFGKHRVFGMITLISGSLLEPAHVRGFKGERVTFVGEIDGSQSVRISQLTETLSNAGLRTVIPNHIETVRWTKLVWWIPLVTLPALTRLTWGEALTQQDLCSVYVHMERECARVAEASGHPPQDYPGLEVARRLSLPFEKAVDDVLEMGHRFVTEGNGGYEVALLLDFKRRRRTEAAHTIGAIVEKARQAGIHVPYADCAWRLIRSIEASF